MSQSQNAVAQTLQVARAKAIKAGNQLSKYMSRIPKVRGRKSFKTSSVRSTDTLDSAGASGTDGSSAEDPIEIAALGRPFRLGMLYDCRKDALIPGITLWDPNDLQINTTEREQQHSECNVTASDSIDEKLNSLRVSGSLKLSLLGGLVNVEGSAKYFQDTKKSHKQERLILQYKTTTKYEELIVSQLGTGQVSHPDVFEDDTATHVVIAISYGAGAYFLFDRESSRIDEDKKQDTVQGEAKVSPAEILTDKLKGLNRNEDTSFNMEDISTSALDKFNCTFHGDFQLPSIPTSFDEAVDIYKKLPTLLGENGEHAVPVRVWLYPLVKLDSKAAKLQREISNSLITYTSGIIEDLNKTEMRCNDLLKDTAATTFPAMGEKLQTFMQNCGQYKLEFVQKLGSVLPSIRGGGKEENALEEILKALKKSPFNSTDLDQWLTQKEKESDTLKSFVKQLEKLGTKLDANLDDLLSDSSITNIVSFSFTSIDQPDNSLKKQTNYLSPAGMVSESSESDVLQNRNTEWLSADTRQIMRRQLQLFEQLKKLINSGDTKFIFSSKYDERYPGACIFIYEDGSDPVPFIPPSKPATPTTSDVSHDGLTVGISDPDSATVEHQVELKSKQETEWTCHSVQKNKKAVTLSGLKPDTEYKIRVTAVGKLGYVVSSDVITAVTVDLINPPNSIGINDMKAASITCVSNGAVTAATKNIIPATSVSVNDETEKDSLSCVSSDSDTGGTAKTTMDPPTNVKVNDVKTDSITLTCRNPADEEYRSLSIEYRMKQETEWMSNPVEKNEKTVKLSGLKPGTEYEIRLTAVGKLGSVVSSVVVTAVTKDISPPSNVQVTDMKTDTITLTWRNAADNQYQSLRIESRMEQETEWTSHPVQQTQETASLSGLKPGTKYEIRLTAVGKLGSVVSSVVVTAVTKDISPPSNVQVTDMKTDTITLTWRNAADNQYQSLRIESRMEQETEWTSHPVQQTQETASLSGLKPGTKYEIRLTAVGKLGSVVSSVVVTVVTKDISPPSNVQVTDIKTDTITLTWRNAADNQYQSLRIESRMEQETEWTSHPVQQTQETASLSGLKEGTKYEIRVTAVGKLGYVVSSDAVTAVTAITPPTNVRVSDKKKDSITLAWRNTAENEYLSLSIEYRAKCKTEWTSAALKRNQETVTLQGLKPGIEYETRLTAVGKLGSVVSSVVVTVVTKDISPPSNVQVTDMKTDTITLTWRNAADNQYQSLRIESRMEQETEWTSHPVQQTQETASLSGLKPGTKYEIRLTAVGKLGSVVSSVVVTAVTKDISPPSNVQVTDMKTDTITLTWRNAADNQYQSLRIESRMEQETEWTSHPVQQTQETASLSGLKEGTKYEIRVTAVGKLGYVVSSDAVTAVTAITPPTNVRVSDKKKDSITLAWRNTAENEYLSLSIEYREKCKTEWTSAALKRKQETVTLQGLKPGIEYETRVTAVGRLGSVVSSGVVTFVTVAVISPPINMKITQEKAKSITLTWSTLGRSGDHEQYIIEYKEENSSNWQKEETKTKDNTFTLINLKANTTYSIRMRTESGNEVSQPGKEIKVKTKKGPLDKINRFTPLSGTPPVYLLNLKRLTCQFNKKTFGNRSCKNPSNKTIMLVGATGSGKTTLINGMINYILGVDWEDNWRFKLIDEETNKSQAHSQTSEVTAYQIYCTDEFQVPYSLTIIDTPGFGDTRGIKQDKEITEKIRRFFTNKDGIDAIEAVCFVVQAALARLTHTQRYIFEAILSVFGKNISSNIITLVTFADGKSPPVLEAIKEANIPCATETDGSPVYFKFNNSVLFANNTGGSGDEGEFDRMFWKIGKASMNKFFTHLGTMETQSLTLTKQVLEERQQLETTIEGVQPLIRKGLSTIEEIRKTKAVLDMHKTQIEANKDFEYEIEVDHTIKIDIPSGTFITNCHGCNYTCHYPCYIARDEDKARCWAMKYGNCTVCPGKCAWSVHFNMTYRWDTERVKEERTYNDLKLKYEESMGEKMNTEQIILKLEEEYHQVQGELVKMMETLTKSLRRLKEIALRPDPLSTPDYIDLMIESEKQEARPGYKERIRELQEVRKGAVIMQKAAQHVALSTEEESKLQKLTSDVKGAVFWVSEKVAEIVTCWQQGDYIE